jgi:hypothetical protein
LTREIQFVRSRHRLPPTSLRLQCDHHAFQRDER